MYLSPWTPLFFSSWLKYLLILILEGISSFNSYYMHSSGSWFQQLRTQRYFKLEDSKYQVNTKTCSHTLCSLQKVQMMFLSHPTALPGAQIPQSQYISTLCFRIKWNFTVVCNQKVAAAYHTKLCRNWCIPWYWDCWRCFSFLNDPPCVQFGFLIQDAVVLIN